MNIKTQAQLKAQLRAELSAELRAKRISEFLSYADEIELSESGKANVKQAVLDGKLFAEQFPLDIIEPIISLASDGEINFCWNINDFKLDLGFYGDNFYSYYGKKADGQEFFGDEIQITEKLPDNLLQFISLGR